jgi:hypothetical protein
MTLCHHTSEAGGKPCPVLLPLAWLQQRPQVGHLLSEPCAGRRYCTSQGSMPWAVRVASGGSWSTSPAPSWPHSQQMRDVSSTCLRAVRQRWPVRPGLLGMATPSENVPLAGRWTPGCAEGAKIVLARQWRVASHRRSGAVELAWKLLRRWRLGHSYRSRASSE